MKGETIEITEPALAKIKDLMNLEDREGWPLRIRVIQAGPKQRYEFTFDSNRASDDHAFVIEGLRVYIDAWSFELIKGSKIDYAGSMKGFKVTNPNIGKG